jgi:hypothetical protein
MTALLYYIMTINDAEGIVTAERYDGHVKWPSDYERQHENNGSVTNTVLSLAP